MEEIRRKASEYCENYEIVARAHYLTADHKRAMHRRLGIPVIIITTVVGTTIFGTLDKSPEPFWRITAGLVSLLGAVLSSLQTSLGFAKDAESHKAAGEAYRAVHRSFELFLLKYAEANDDERDTAFKELSELVERLKDLPKEFPSIPDRLYDKAKSELDAAVLDDVHPTTTTASSR